MIRVSVFARWDLTDTYLRQMAALGADCLDFGGDTDLPGVKEQGYPDLDGLKAMRRRIRSYGLDINRVTLPNFSDKFMKDQPGGQTELDNACRALEVMGQARIPIARQRFAGDVFVGHTARLRTPHRGGYMARAESLAWAEEPRTWPSKMELDDWWDHFVRVFEKLTPIAEEYDIQLAVHPSDTPNPETPFGGIGFHRVIDAFPSANVGYVYCIGTRSEAGGSSLVMDEINHYGRKGKIFMVHMRNVRGSLATAGGYEEVLLDDGDLNMFRVLKELHKVGFHGCINPDHIPDIPGDTEQRSVGWAYSIGYIKALLAALMA